MQKNPTLSIPVRLGKHLNATQSVVYMGVMQCLVKAGWEIFLLTLVSGSGATGVTLLLRRTLSLQHLWFWLRHKISK